MGTPKRAERGRRVRHLARIAVLAALGRDGALEAALRKARKAGVPLVALRETLLQVCLFAGFPRTVNALEALERALGPLPPPARERRPAGRGDVFAERGRRLFRRVYGRDAGTVLDRIGRRHPEFRDWILADAYGKVLGRRGLPAAERECVAVALLTVLDLPRQLAPHLRGALRCGATPAEIRAAREEAGTFSSYKVIPPVNLGAPTGEGGE